MKTIVGYPDDRIRRGRLAWIAETLRNPLSQLASLLRKI
jgi:hypothetical protein